MVQLSKENMKEMVGGKCRKGGAIMAECLKRADELGKEGLLQDGVHRELYDQADDKQSFISFLRFCSERLDKGETVQAIWNDYQELIAQI